MEYMVICSVLFLSICCLICLPSVSNSYYLFRSLFPRLFQYCKVSISSTSAYNRKRAEVKQWRTSCDLYEQRSYDGPT